MTVVVLSSTYFLNESKGEGFQIVADSSPYAGSKIGIRILFHVLIQIELWQSTLYHLALAASLAGSHHLVSQIIWEKKVCYRHFPYPFLQMVRNTWNFSWIFISCWVIIQSINFTFITCKNFRMVYTSSEWRSSTNNLKFLKMQLNKLANSIHAWHTSWTCI